MSIRPKRIIRKKISNSVELNSFSENITEWIYENWKFILLLAVVVAAAFFGSYFYMMNKGKQEQKAFAYFSQGMHQYQNLKKDASKEEVDKSIELLKDVVKKSKGKRAALYARLYIGHIHFKVGEYEKAKQFYQKVLSTHDGEDLLSALSREGIAYSSLAAGKYQEAETELKKIIASPSVFVKRETYLKLAEAYEGMKNDDALLNTLETILKEFSDDPENETISERIALLKK